MLIKKKYYKYICACGLLKCFQNVQDGCLPNKHTKHSKIHLKYKKWQHNIILLECTLNRYWK